ncbi:hypothetical protein ANN_13892 [Periplaneta americana]|uniref:Uncharacterized protein n=1 Tax=Periplaneta americana TaxID=6978 RepID=A0ABQ8SUT0_PERAM|nr:hypothetical protein ANN_13892 [Periplaneta americana]
MADSESYNMFHSEYLCGTTYLDMVEQFFFPQIEHLQTNILFQQVGAPPHWVNDVRTTLDNVFPGRWIDSGGPIASPLSSPNLTSLDFFLWGYVKDKVYDTPVRRDLRDLRERIIEAIERIPEDMLQRAWQEIVHRLDIVTVTAGAHSLMLAGSEFQSLGRAIVKEDEYEEVRWDGCNHDTRFGHRCSKPTACSFTSRPVRRSPEPQRLLLSTCASVLVHAVAELSTALEESRGLVNELKLALDDRNKKIRHLECRIDDMEQYQRRQCLRIFGVPEVENEDTDVIAIQVAEKTGVSLQVSDIDRSHRVGKRRMIVPGPSL